MQEQPKESIFQKLWKNAEKLYEAMKNFITFIDPRQDSPKAAPSTTQNELPEHTKVVNPKVVEKVSAAKAHSGVTTNAVSAPPRTTLQRDTTVQPSRSSNGRDF